MTKLSRVGLYLALTMTVLCPSLGFAASKQPIEAIEDNSFLVEEAYNQDAGVVQHIFTAVYDSDSRRPGWTFNFTQEWPLFSHDHQFSYSIPSYHYRDGADRVYGVGDVLLNYRYQAFEESEVKPAFAPRFSLIVPTGSRRRGTGNNVVGYQWNLPFSKALGPSFAVHANLGVTYLPQVRALLDVGANRLSPSRSLVSYNAGASGIFALAPRFHLMLEWVGLSEEKIDDAGKAARTFKPTLSPGVRAAVVDESKLQIVVGAAVPVGLNRKADNYGALLYFSIEHDLF